MEKADSKSKKAVKCIFDSVYFHIITSLYQFFFHNLRLHHEEDQTLL